VFVLDTSGSMSGIPLDTARAAVRRALDDLGPDDSATVSTTTVSYRVSRSGKPSQASP